jgi:hypothetical protein
MSLTKKISKIKNLESIQPDKRWEKTTKYDLLEEIASQNRLMQAYKLSNAQKIDLFVMRFFNRIAPSLSKALTVFLVFMMFFGVNIAAQASVPGQPLWPVKRSIEEAEISLTFSPVKKTEVHIKHVSERLDEIDKILDKPEEIDKPEVKIKKDKAIKQAINHLSKDVTSVDSALKIVKEEKEALEVVELVKKVTDATKEVDNQLAAKKKEAATTNDKELGEALTAAKAVNKQVKKAAVAVAIEVHEEVQKNLEDNAALKIAEANIQIENPELLTADTETSTPEIIESVNTKEEQLDIDEAAIITNLVKEIVAAEIADVSTEVKDVKEKVEIVDQVELDIIKIDAIGEEDKDKIVTAELDEIDVIKKESIEESEVVLEEAKVLLEEGSFKDAFEKVSEANDKYEKAEVTLEKIEDAIEVNQEEVTEDVGVIEVLPDTSTSTQNLDIKPVENPEQSRREEEIIEASGVDIVEEGILEEEQE